MALLEIKPPWKEFIFYKGGVYENDTFAATYDKWSYDFKENEFELSKLREQIDNYEKKDDGKWEYYKKVVNPYELVFTQKKYTNFPESVCVLHPLSRSYFKMIEMLSITDFFKVFEREDKFRTAHVCEGPGGFIESIIDLTIKHRKILSQATAMTLRPNQSNVPGWKRASNFLQKHKNVKVVYGEDNTGDILKVENQLSFIQSCGPKVHLFTSDGGFDFSIDYLSQEKFIFPLLLASTRIGFEVLKEGGVFILKFFDIYYDGIRDLLYFLSTFFRSWTLYKPATSRPCNPEQYFIGKGFKGCSPDVINKLHNWCNHIQHGFIPNRVCICSRSAEFDEQLDKIIIKSVQSQVHYLKQVFNLIEHSSEKDIENLLKMYEIISYKWCQTFNVPVYAQRIKNLTPSLTITA